MSKYVIPFIRKDNWETNSNCELCEATNELYNGVLDKTAYNIQAQTDFLDKYYLVDGYGLLPVYEKNGVNIYDENKISNLRKYNNSSDEFMKRVHNVLYPDSPQKISDPIAADAPTILYGRWCKRCGSRKPDIYDSARAESFGLLNIVNFRAEVIDGRINIYWRDSESSVWGKAKLFRDGVAIETTIVKNKYENSSFKEILPNGIVYRYKVVNYDFLDEAIQSTEEIEVYVPVTETIAPGPCLNTTAQQVRRIYKENGSYVTKDVILVNWENPTDEDFEDCVLRMGEQFFVPADEKDGAPAAKEMVFEDYDILIGHTYYFKPFPYDREKVKPHAGDAGYVSYRNYGLDSDYASVVVKPHTGDVGNIAVLQDDGFLRIGWKDPDEENWLKTIVIYKEDDGYPIRHEKDGMVIKEITERHVHLTNPLNIPDLTNGKTYRIGIFPVSKDGLVNVNYVNQAMGTPGYYLDSQIYSPDNLMPYMGAWEVVGNAFNTNANDTICFFEVTRDVKYGGRLSFDYRADGIKGGGHFAVFQLSNPLLKTSLDTDWTNVQLQIEPGTYSKFIFEARKGFSPISVSLRNVRFDFNYYPRGES